MSEEERPSSYETKSQPVFYQGRSGRSVLPGLFVGGSTQELALTVKLVTTFQLQLSLLTSTDY